MSFVAVAIGGAAVVGAGAAVYAANKQSAGQQQAANTQQGMFNTVNQNSQPFIQAGYGATSDLRGLLGEAGTPGTTVGNTGLQQGYLTQQFDPNSLNGNPAYEFALQQGGQATRNADTPGVGALSGAALKDLTNFNVGTANQYENQYYNQFQTNQNSIYDRLAGIAGLGQSAAAGVGNSGTQLGTGIAQAQAGSAASQAGGVVGASNALTGGATSLAGLMYLNGGQSYAPGASQNGTGSGVNTSPGYGGGTNVNGYYEGGPNGKIGGPVYSGMTKFSGLKHMAEGGPVGSQVWNGNPQQVTNGPTQPAQPNGTAMPAYGPVAPNGTGGSNPVGGLVSQATWDFGNGSEAPGGMQVGSNSPISYPIGSIIAPNSTQVIGSMGGAPQQQTAPTAPPIVPGSLQDPNVSANQQGLGEVGGGTPQTLSGMVNGPSTGGWTGSNWGQNQWQGSDPYNPDPTNPSIGAGIVGGGAKNGGPIYGPGTQTSDDVPTMLSNGEHVISAAEINALGDGDNALGQQRMLRLRDMIKQGGKRA